MKGKFEDDVDALYQLPLAEFTAARNSLASELKKGGRAEEANLVKTLAKPSISAWAVNQLYWKHRAAFDRLIATAERVRKAQTSRNPADTRVALDARREALSQVSDLASGLMRDGGHNPTPDTLRRVTTTVEALSVYAAIPGGPRPGRLSDDVDPPGFELLASLVSGAKLPKPAKEPTRVTPPQQPARAAASTRPKTESAAELRQQHQAKMAAAKESLREAKSSLVEAQAKVQSLETEQKKALGDARNAEKERREAEYRLEKAKAASQTAARNAQNITAEVTEAANALKEAKRAVEKVSKELEKLFRGSK